MGCRDYQNPENPGFTESSRSHREGAGRGLRFFGHGIGSGPPVGAVETARCTVHHQRGQGLPRSGTTAHSDQRGGSGGSATVLIRDTTLSTRGLSVRIEMELAGGDRRERRWSAH